MDLHVHTNLNISYTQYVYHMISSVNIRSDMAVDKYPVPLVNTSSMTKLRLCWQVHLHLCGVLSVLTHSQILQYYAAKRIKSQSRNEHLSEEKDFPFMSYGQY